MPSCPSIPFVTFYVHNLSLVLWSHYMVFVKVFVGKSKIFDYIMKQNQKPCAIQSEEDEYE